VTCGVGLPVGDGAAAEGDLVPATLLFADGRG